MASKLDLNRKATSLKPRKELSVFRGKKEKSINSNQYLPSKAEEKGGTVKTPLKSLGTNRKKRKKKSF